MEQSTPNRTKATIVARGFAVAFVEAWAARRPGRPACAPSLVCAWSLPIVMCCACFPEPNVYRGIGSVQTNAAPSTELATHSVTFKSCAGIVSASVKSGTGGASSLGGEFQGQDQNAFPILAIGDQCVIEGTFGTGGVFHPVTGGVCTLAFADGVRTLRVTDVMVRYGDIDPAYVGFTFGEPYVFTDRSHIEVQVAGADAKSGELALYRFLGRAVSGTDDQARCELPVPPHQ